MSKIVKEAEGQLYQCILDAMGRCVSGGVFPASLYRALISKFRQIPPTVITRQTLQWCALARLKWLPVKIARAILEEIDLSGTYFEKAEIAGPGFMNFFLNQSFFAAVLQDINDCGENYGRSDYGQGKKIMVEYISANPTGFAMHMGNARGGVAGDCLAAVLDYAGYQVHREFYINDAGNQIDKFALSLEVRYLQKYLGEDAVELPEDSYHGEDIKARAEEFAQIHGDSYVNADQQERRKALVDFALPKNIEKMQSDLEKYRIKYDCWL